MYILEFYLEGQKVGTKEYKRLREAEEDMDEFMYGGYDEMDTILLFKNKKFIDGVSCDPETLTALQEKYII